MTNFDVIVVGSGPAGMTAAIYATRADLSVLVLDKLAPGGNIINTNEIQNYPGVGFINGAELAIQMFEQVQKIGAEFDYRTVLSIVDKGEVKEVHCEEDEKVYTARAVIIATGTQPNHLHCAGEDQFTGNGISWCAICDGASYRDRDVVVIGGGNSAVEESIYLAGMVNKLTVVTMFDLTADPVACDQLRAMDNVTVYPYQDVLSFDGVGKLEGVRFKSTKDDAEERFVPCDGVFEYIGLHPVTDFCKSLGICNQFGYIQADAAMRTAVPGIYGAGDCIVKDLRQVITACADGAIAAQSAFQDLK